MGVFHKISEGTSTEEGEFRYDFGDSVISITFDHWAWSFLIFFQDRFFFQHVTPTDSNSVPKSAPASEMDAFYWRRYRGSQNKSLLQKSAYFSDITTPQQGQHSHCSWHFQIFATSLRAWIPLLDWGRIWIQRLSKQSLLVEWQVFSVKLTRSTTFLHLLAKSWRNAR